MPQRNFTKIAEFQDKYGQSRVVRKHRSSSMRLEQVKLTPAIALTRVIGTHLAHRLKECRLAAGLTYQDAADKAGLLGGKKALYAIESQVDQGVRLGTLYLLCRVYGVEPRSLLPDPAIAIEEANIVRRRKETLEIE